MLLLLLSSVKRSNINENPDHVIDIPIDHVLLQDGYVYKSCGYMRRQVVDIKIQRVITEYRAEILEDQNGNQNINLVTYKS
jgi:transposase